jgi:hypothetical protein
MLLSTEIKTPEIPNHQAPSLGLFYLTFVFNVLYKEMQGGRVSPDLGLLATTTWILPPALQLCKHTLCASAEHASEIHGVFYACNLAILAIICDNLTFLTKSP